MPDPLTTLDWPVRTERLTLRRAEPEDAELTWAYRRLPEVFEWITNAPQTLADYTAYFVDPVRLAMTLPVELDGRVIGDLMLRVTDAWGQAEVRDRTVGVVAELGWAFDPAYGGKGFATEAVRGAIGLCFGPLGLHRVVAECFADNAASWKLMERVGMRREGHTRRDALHRRGDWLDGYSYALLREEWPPEVGG